MKKNTLSKKQKKYLIIFSAIFVVLLAVFVVAYKLLNSNKITLTEEYVLYIPTGSQYTDVMDSLIVSHCLTDTSFFSKLAHYKGYPAKVRPGRYVLKPGMSVNSMLNKLKSGNQDPVKLVVGKFRTKETLAGRLAKKMEFDSLSILRVLQNDSLLKELGYNSENSIAIFTQNTYEVYWNTTPEDFLERMKKETDDFWNGSRTRKAEDMGLSRMDIVILASIVDEETNQDAEKADIASVYLNRLRKDMLLQADPTVRFAVQDFEIRRIRRQHLQYDSPYNTYIYKGLPPAPICIPSIASIDAVLENKHTNYYFFCAKDDFSGSHNFATSIEEHYSNAKKFHKALNKRNIHK